MDLDEGQRAAALGIDRRMDRLDQRALARAARAPEQGVVGRQAPGEAPRVVQQDVAVAIDPAQQLELDPAHPVDRLEAGALGMPDEGLGAVEGGRGRVCRGQALEGFGDLAEQGKE